MFATDISSEDVGATFPQDRHTGAPDRDCLGGRHRAPGVAWQRKVVRVAAERNSRIAAWIDDAALQDMSLGLVDELQPLETGGALSFLEPCKTLR